jgi:hypothetical protein
MTPLRGLVKLQGYCIRRQVTGCCLCPPNVGRELEQSLRLPFLTLRSSTKAIRASLSDFTAYAVHFFTVSSLNSHRALATFGSLASLLGATALQFSSKYNPLNLSGSALASVPTARYKLGTAPFSGLFDMNVLTSHQTGPSHPIVIPASPSVATAPGLRDVEIMGMFSASIRRWSSDVNRMFAVLLTALRDVWLRTPV